MKKILLALTALALIASPAMAKSNHNYWHGKNHNYWHGHNNYWGGGIYYNSPNVWGGFYGGNGGYNYWGGYYSAPRYYNYNVVPYRSRCHIEYAPRCVQGLGCQPVEEYVCN